MSTFSFFYLINGWTAPVRAISFSNSAPSRDIARLSDEGISNAFRVALERHLGQAEPSQDLDENAKRIAMAMEKAAEEMIPEKDDN